MIYINKKVKEKNTNTKRMLYRMVYAVIAFLIFIFVFGAIFSFLKSRYRSWELKNLPSTDLSNITVDTMQMDSDIKNFDLSLYQESNRFGNRNHESTYNFDEMVLDIDNHKISYIFAFKEDVLISLNQRKDISNIEEITSILGENYLEKKEDREQRLRKHIYFDHEIGVVAEFIYSEYDGEFVWIVLRKIDE